MPVITPGQRDYLVDPSYLKETSQKNFIRENIKQLKQIEKKNRKENKKKLEVHENPIVFPRRPLGKSKSQSKFGVRKRLVESKSSKSIIKSIPKSPTTQVEIVKAVSSLRGRPNRNKKAFKAQGIQAGGGDVANVSDNESIGREQYVAPPAPSRGDRKDQSLQCFGDVREQSFSPFNVEDIKREMKAVQDIDYVKLNQLVQYKPKKNTKCEKVDPTKAPPTYQRGVLPKYLREQKKDVDGCGDHVVPIREKEVHQNLVNPIPVPNRKTSGKESAGCPPGHILISELERKQQLNELRRHYAELINKLNRFPVNVDHQKTRQMKSELESEIENLEAAITMFSKEKLYVKIS